MSGSNSLGRTDEHIRDFPEYVIVKKETIDEGGEYAASPTLSVVKVEPQNDNNENMITIPHIQVKSEICHDIETEHAPSSDCDIYKSNSAPFEFVQTVIGEGCSSVKMENPDPEEGSSRLDENYSYNPGFELDDNHEYNSQGEEISSELFDGDNADRQTEFQHYQRSLQLLEGTLNCEHCDYLPISEDDLEQHLQNFHTEEYEKFLNENFRTDMNDLPALNASQIKDVDKNANKYKCKQCSYSAPKSHNLKMHYKVVHLKLETYKCDKCSFTTAETSNLTQHYNTVHSKKKHYKCEYCNYVAPMRFTVTKHTELVHLKNKTFDCNLCEFSSVSNENLKRHIKIVHLKHKKLKCEYCDYPFADKTHLKEHVYAMHLKIKPFECKLCGFVTSRKQALKNHMDIVHLETKRHKCGQCAHSANSKRDILRHTISAHSPGHTLKCKICDYGASRHCDINKHMRLAHKNDETSVESQ